jgi:hypothetical protein
MPAAKKATRKATRKTPKRITKRLAKRSGPRKMSAAHKTALAEGRTMSANVDRYLAAINTPKQRGRKVSQAAMQQRLDIRSGACEVSHWCCQGACR